MESRRDFIKKATLLSSGAGLLGVLPPSIQKALAINPAEGSTFWDAEHVVILMQENRSFDHSYGTLQGVRGFNDPRAIRLPNKNKVWFQSNAKGETYAPFRLNLKDSKATWMSSLPHSWENQVDARNNGKYDKWLFAKASGNKDYKEMPLTLGYYNREDIPFYYALADAFTVCDQNFCSSLTGTTPNRLYLWTGTIREKADFNAKANVKNEDVDYGKWAKWKTFPERLEENGVSWKIYQNEISLPTGLVGEEDAWLSNFTDNPIEWFEQYHVKFSPEYYKYIQKVNDILPNEIADLEKKLASLDGQVAEKTKQELARKKTYLETIKQDLLTYAPENFDKLSDFHKNLHKKAFVNNRLDPHYRELTNLEYDDNGTPRIVEVPKGDVLYQFRKDVETKQLPTVSWLVAPENFSDHPGAPWYGAWYVSEVMDILTKNPEIWKKTIFILAYDENDGYFDHVPPFVAPHHQKPDSGKVSAGIDPSVEQVNIIHEKQRPYKNPEKDTRENPIGLGFRVPLVIASPWSRGGNVCSEVFDHTSIIQFLEKFLKNKTKKDIVETNISDWRRTVCGDLTSTFKPYNGEKIGLPKFVAKEPFIQTVHKAKFKQLPSNYKSLSTDDVVKASTQEVDFEWMPKQEKGIRKSMPIPYELYADGRMSEDKKRFEVSLGVGDKVFGKKAKGCPFVAYFETNELKTRNYAVKGGDILYDTWALDSFTNQQYKVEIYGPNGFYRSFIGDEKEPFLEVNVRYQGDKTDKKSLTGNVVLELKNRENKTINVVVNDLSYKTPKRQVNLTKGGTTSLVLNLQESHHWYDFSVKVEGNDLFEKRYAGHVETGRESYTDPLMGGVI
ncbi:phospholipase C, phosphocholine-specific [Emticicia oligotrophica DSM 17448]|uniref:phospholipase C n=1 Tax=Emticicia oligotrophica (strain DSM 17448 / CIP 109782 / MTCC 6937 / GPTSA100-15) TaxID=929562 RepID=A0ABM5MX14_EMTOG|nr:phospholipase C, phosphocholine-specific [Emticicia oligotrophica]AFK01537.1 phospholipase C, phosphocholine-specific [Emticicia oligotrophica DSM 17448]